MYCQATSTHEHQWSAPLPNKHLEYCSACGIWRIHDEDLVVWLPPANALARARLQKTTTRLRHGKVLTFRSAFG